MDSVFNCFIGLVDVRDYTLIDVLGRISRQRNEDLQFAIWTFNPSTNTYAIFHPDRTGKDRWKTDLSLEGAQNQEVSRELIFRQYDNIRFSSSLSLPDDVGTPLSPSVVLIPLNFRFLEQQSALSLTLEAGIITLKDSQDKRVGSLSLENGIVQLIPVIPEQPSDGDTSKREQPFEGKLIISQTDQLILKPKEEIKHRLFLGQGFLAHEMDLHDWSPIEDQAPLHLCAANAAISVIEHFERKANGRHLNASRLFLHQAACHLLNLPPTAGSSVRSAVAALATFGVPPESSWPYSANNVEVEPSAWCYAQARNYRASSYLRLDRPGMDKDALIAQIKLFVYSGIPAIFGFSIHEGVEQAGPMPTSEQPQPGTQPVPLPQQPRIDSEPMRRLSLIEQALGIPKQVENYADQLFGLPGHIPFPTFSELYSGGHAAVVVGYDDQKIIVNRQPLTRHDRNKLNLPGVKAFLLTEQGQWAEYQWQGKGYVKVTTAPLDFKAFQFMQCEDFKGLFILLVRRPFNLDNSTQASDAPLMPRDVLFESNDTVGRNETVVDEYLATKGAFKIRNSWGKAWGEEGYGWLPYAYVYQDLTFDWWSILKFEWMNTDEFGLLRNQDDLVMCVKPKGSSTCIN